MEQRPVKDRIRGLRQAKGMSQDELANAIGYKDKTSISKIESGDHNVSLKTIEKLADFFGVSPAYIAGWDDTIPDMKCDPKERLYSDTYLKYQEQKLQRIKKLMLEIRDLKKEIFTEDP